jgi:hypothetical protein
MHTGVKSARSRPLEPSPLLDYAAKWHLRGGESVRDALIEPDQETVLMISYCLRPDEYHCFTTTEIFTPTIGADHEARGTFTGPDAFAYASRFFSWLQEHESARELEGWGAVFYLAESQERLENGDTTAFQLQWSKARRENGSGRALRLQVGKKSSLVSDRQKRAQFFDGCLDTLGLQEYIAITMQEERLVFNSKEPWGVFPEGDEYPREDPYMMEVFPLDGVSELASCAYKLLAATQHKVIRIALIVESLMEVHNRICETIPPAYRGWEMNSFGAPSESLQAWFAGDLKARPPGRIPIGRGWEGDPNLGFSYSVCVVETPDGPCIELGSDTATHDHLRSLSKYFEGLKFHPI